MRFVVINSGMSTFPRTNFTVVLMKLFENKTMVDKKLASN